MSFDPKPKRAKVNDDNETLALREFPNYFISLPYDKALESDDAIALKLLTTEACEQPDGGDLTDYE